MGGFYWDEPDQDDIEAHEQWELEREIQDSAPKTPEESFHDQVWGDDDDGRGYGQGL
jgi:hypothetical protein